MRKYIKFFVPFSSLLIFLIGGMVIFGWILHIPTLVQILPTLVPMQFNTALSALICAASLLLVFYEKERWSGWIIWIPIAIGVLTLLQYLFGVNLGIDELFIQHPITTKTSDPGRMAPNTAISYIITGIAIFLFSTKWRASRWLAAILASFILALSLTALIGYGTRIASAYGWYGLTDMALSTAISFLFLSLNVFFQSLSFDARSHLSNWLLVPLIVLSVSVTLFLWKAIDVHWAYQAINEDGAVSYITIAFAILSFCMLLYLALIAIDKMQRTEEENTLLLSTVEKKQEIINHLSHEIRSPLSAILGFTEILEENATGEQEKKAYIGITSGAEHIKKIVNDLIAFSHYESGSIEAELREFEVEKWFVNLVNILKMRAQMKGIAFSYHLDPQIPKTVTTDANKVAQIIINLVENGLKYTPHPGNVSLSIEYLMERSQLKISVQDSGKGIPRSLQKKIFLPRFRVTSEGREEGMGMGLAVCTLYAEILGGSLIVKSDEGIGSEFIFTVNISN